MAEPATISDMSNCHKNVQYSSRLATHMHRQRQVSEQVRLILESERNSAHVQNLGGHGCLTRMHVAPLLAPWRDKENKIKDIDLSAARVRRRWDESLLDNAGILERVPWDDKVNPGKGMIGTVEARR